MLRQTALTIHDGDDENDNVVNTGLDFPRVDMLALGQAILALAPHSSAISGTVWNDRNGDGQIETGEPGLSGWTVFLDLNGNTQPDTTVTANLPSANVPLSIPDAGTRTSATVVSGLPVGIRDLNVTLDITHTRDDNLDVFLVSPTGTRVELFTDVGGRNDNFSATTLDDQAAVSITSGAAPFSGSYRPEGALSDFSGETPNGTWTLEVTDDNAKQTGVLNSWSITITSGVSEPTTISSADGAFNFAGLGPGTYTVRVIVQSPWNQTFPTGGPTQTVPLSSGQEAAGINFGYWSVILGDFNGDGVMNSLDIADFKLALSDGPAWDANTGRNSTELGDFNLDGLFNSLDITMFKDALGQSSPAVASATRAVTPLAIPRRNPPDKIARQNYLKLAVEWEWMQAHRRRDLWSWGSHHEKTRALGPFSIAETAMLPGAPILTGKKKAD
jgi:subtilisin-like proprotein convertase family protein